MGFTRVLETIPAEGETVEIQVSARSILIEQANIYSFYSDIPTFSFQSAGRQKQPIYNGGTYQDPKGVFDKIILHGNAEAEGDEVGFLFTSACLTPNIHSESLLGMSRIGEPGETKTKLMNDSVLSFSDMELRDSENRLPVKLFVSCAPIPAGERGIKFTFIGNPAQGKETKGHYLGEEIREIKGLKWILESRWINEVATETPMLVWTGEY